MSPNEALQIHWTKVFAGVVYHAQTPVEVEIVQDSEAHTIRVIPVSSRAVEDNDRSKDVVEKLKVMILKDPDASYLTTAIGGLAKIKIGSQLTTGNKKYTHTGVVTDDSPVYMVAEFERRIRAIQG
jgi:hypothetical protein